LDKIIIERKNPVKGKERAKNGLKFQSQKRKKLKKFSMVRVKRGKTANKRRKRLLKLAKGFRWSRKSKYRLAKEALLHAFKYAYRDRKAKKREFRKLWQIQISAAVRPLGFSYSKFIHLLKEKKIELDRKTLATLAKKHAEVFEKIVEKVKL